jgi:DNA repair exonuclease SbcCD nuclease subunit
VSGCFNVGLLHTNTGGLSQHASYAPCTVNELVAKGYNYWALGHVHEHGILHRDPHVVYPGNCQGRHARETGPKGCLLVTVDEADGSGTVQDVEFRETDLVRWFRKSILLEPAMDEDALLEATRKHLHEVASDARGRLAAVRLEFSGQCAVHSQIARDAKRLQLMANLRALGADFGDDLWIEKIKFQTRSPLDIEALRERQDLIGQLLRDVNAMALDPLPLSTLQETKDLASKVATELLQDEGSDDVVDFEDPARLVGWLRDAEALLLSHLIDGGSAP